MKIGLLWFDDDPGRELAEKVRRAASHYRQKHGHAPNTCLVHPDALNGNTSLQVDGVEVRAGHAILPHHFWIGACEERSPSQHKG